MDRPTRAARRSCPRHRHRPRNGATRQARVAELGNATFEVADLYRWRPPAAYDVVSFSFLLSHVPTMIAPAFRPLVTSSLEAGGLVGFVDAAPGRRDEEAWLGDGVARRTLPDGSRHRIVKAFPTPEQIIAETAENGLEDTVEPRGDSFLVGRGRQRAPHT